MGSELSPEVLAIHQWIRDDAPVTIQMTITPKLISALAERLQLARSKGPHPEQIAENANCSSPGQLLAESASYPGPAESVSYSQAEFDECGQIGERDGYERAVADIDRLTGGDGEFYVSTVPGRGCSDVETMKARIVERFNQRPGESGEWDDHEDEISDAISDSIDMDWTSRDGAKAVIRYLKGLSND